MTRPIWTILKRIEPCQSICVVAISFCFQIWTFFMWEAKLCNFLWTTIFRDICRLLTQLRGKVFRIEKNREKGHEICWNTVKSATGKKVDKNASQKSGRLMAFGLHSWSIGEREPLHFALLQCHGIQRVGNNDGSDTFQRVFLPHTTR